MTNKKGMAWESNKPVAIGGIEVAPPQDGEVRIKVRKYKDKAWSVQNFTSPSLPPVLLLTLVYECV
uniref:Uncharacterized protein n=1 Tax=Sphaeramia orbicularis TaxID=375764 RepID=A0A673CP41_9TELE